MRLSPNEISTSFAVKAALISRRSNASSIKVTGGSPKTLMRSMPRTLMARSFKTRGIFVLPWPPLAHRIRQRKRCTLLRCLTSCPASTCLLLCFLQPQLGMLRDCRGGRQFDMERTSSANFLKLLSTISAKKRPTSAGNLPAWACATLYSRMQPDLNPDSSRK